MSAPHDGLIVETTEGRLRGTAEGGARVFRGVPYAAPPVGPLRFRPPQPPAPWQGVREAVRHGPIPPQNRGRLAALMGDFDRPQGEDCLSLTIWAPAPDGPPAPVILFLPGGAYMTGAGSLDWYDGARFAEAGLVFVGVNHRLGALGYLHLPSLSTGNLGLRDQRAALLWVRDNIAAFGGDPGALTLMGQSAGGAAIAALLTMPDLRGAVRRAIIQSPSLGRLVRDPGSARQAAARFLALLGLDEERAERLRAVPVADLLAAQAAFARSEKRFADTRPPFQPVREDALFRGDVLAALRAGAAAGVDVVIGTTGEEMAAFYAQDAEVKAADEARVREVFVELLGPGHAAALEAYRRSLPSARPDRLLGALYTDLWFRGPSLALAEAQAANGAAAQVYQFDWPSPAGHGACHCLDLPFVFGNLAAWRQAPMLAGADPEEMAGLGRAMHGAWCAFARGGRPDHDDLPPWPPYEERRRITMRFDRVITPVGDPAGRSWRPPLPVGAGLL
jgi:para-nitrobenzyl esterase